MEWAVDRHQTRFESLRYTRTMQKIATKVFIAASVVFGVVGIVYWITVPIDDTPSSDLNNFLFRLLGITATVILASFALSVASKYLTNGD